MASRSDVDRLALLNSRISDLTIGDLNTFWKTLDLSRPEDARDALLRFLPLLVAKFGDIAATVSADWYSDVRAAAGVTSRFRPILAPGVPTAKIDGTTRRLAGNLFTDEPLLMLDGLSAWISKYALQPGRDTIVQSARRDPWKPRFARVPTGATTCSFCLMISSRGAVYWTRETAGDSSKFHPHDDCQIVPIGKDQSLPEGYDPGELYDQYKSMQALDLLEHTH